LPERIRFVLALNLARHAGDFLRGDGINLIQPPDNESDNRGGQEKQKNPAHPAKKSPEQSGVPPRAVIANKLVAELLLPLRFRLVKQRSHVHGYPHVWFIANCVPVPLPHENQKIGQF
jgi:hypothetical protein